MEIILNEKIYWNNLNFKIAYVEQQILTHVELDDFLSRRISAAQLINFTIDKRNSNRVLVYLVVLWNSYKKQSKIP